MSSTQPQIKRFACSGCGSTLEFDPTAGQLKCPYCGREEALPEATATVEERSFEQFVNTNHTQIAALSTTALEVECPGCRAQLSFEPPDVAGKCPFCATSIVTQPHAANPVLMPEALLPFSISQKSAKASIQKWLNNRWFAPSSLKKLAQHEGMQGLYLPFWTYDAKTHSYYRGERGTYYYTTETYTETNSEGKSETKTRQVRHTRWQTVCGEVDRFFDDVLIPATESVDVKRLDALEPWSLSKLVPYDSSYLSGFKAQRYQVQLEPGFDRAKEKIVPSIRETVRRDIGGDEQRIHQVSIDYQAVTFKHILLPIWLSSYRYRNKQYQVMVNAQTGEVLGDRPYSIWKITAAVLAAVTVVTGVFFGMVYYKSSPPSQPNAPSMVPLLPDQVVVSGYSNHDVFHQALTIAGQAATLTQSAQTKEEWQQVADGWAQAIELLKQVAPESPNYARAELKIQDYQRNLDYAQQQVAKY